MTDETLMAYADGELDAIAAKRVEQAIAAAPALAGQVAAHRRLRAALGTAFDGIADEAVPERLRVAVMPNVVPLRRAARPVGIAWATAIAASLVLGIGIGSRLGDRGDLVERDGGLAARGGLARALDRQLAGTGGEARMLVSFRDGQGRVCRVFDTAATAGIACRDAGRWAVVRTRPGAGPNAGAAYRQAGSADAALLAEAQDMMSGEPLDGPAEAQARAGGWRSAPR